MSTASIHHALLRPAVLQILRAVGFHSARPSVVDTLTDITARYLTLLATRTAAHAFENHNDYTPDITDVRLALVDSGLLVPSLTATEEAWKEILRKPLDNIPERNGLRAMEAARRDEEDTNEIAQFIEWFRGPVHFETKRIAGLVAEEGQAVELEEVTGKEDYLTALKKKHSKTGEESRFQGTVLGKGAEVRILKIEGGPETLGEWHKNVRHQPQKNDSFVASDSHHSSEDTVMAS